VKGERREHYRAMRKGAADVLKALRWTPPKSRRRTLAHTAECEAQALAVRAIAGATKRCAGRRESDEEWEAMEQLLAGRLPEPSVMDQDPPEDIMREYDTRVVTSLKALQQTAASIIKVREGKRKGLEAERKERVAAETEHLREGQKERKERIRKMEWAANACICWRRRRHRQRDAEEKEREEAERRLEAGRGRTTRAMGMTLKTTHCELEGEGQRRKRGDRNDDAASAGGKRRQRGDEDDEQRGEQTASGAREGDHAGENRRDEGKETRPARKRRQTARYVAGPATGSAGKQKEQDQEHGDEGRREALRRQAAEAAAKVTTAMLTTGGTVVGAKVGPSSIAEGELGLLATRRLEKFEVCSIYTGEIFRTGTAQPPETVPAELSRHTAAGGTQLDGSDDESEDDFDSVAARCNFDWPAASNEPKRGTRATHFVRYEEIQLGKAAAQVMVLFAERGVKEGQEITWSYGDSYRSHRKEMGYKAGTKADPNAITPQQARTAFARYCKKIDVTREELAWNFGCISASQSNEQEAVLVRELILSNNKRPYHGAQSGEQRGSARDPRTVEVHSLTDANRESSIADPAPPAAQPALGESAFSYTGLSHAARPRAGGGHRVRPTREAVRVAAVHGGAEKDSRHARGGRSRAVPSRGAPYHVAALVAEVARDATPLAAFKTWAAILVLRARLIRRLAPVGASTARVRHRIGPALELVVAEDATPVVRIQTEQARRAVARVAKVHAALAALREGRLAHPIDAPAEVAAFAAVGPPALLPVSACTVAVSVTVGRTPPVVAPPPDALGSVPVLARAARGEVAALVPSVRVGSSSPDPVALGAASQVVIGPVAAVAA